MTVVSLHLSLDAYEIAARMALEDGGQLVIFASFPSAGVTYDEILGREVFLFDQAGIAAWQIDPERGTTEGRTHEFDRTIPTTEPFVTVWQANGLAYASRMNGDTFRIDMETGVGTYSGWART